MTKDFLYLKTVAQTEEFQKLVSFLFTPWGPDKLCCIAERFRKQYKLECQPSTGREIVLYVSGTRQDQPAFIVVHSRDITQFDYKYGFISGMYKVEVVEAGKYDVARTSKEPEIRPEEEG